MRRSWSLQARARHSRRVNFCISSLCNEHSVISVVKEFLHVVVPTCPSSEISRPVEIRVVEVCIEKFARVFLLWACKQTQPGLAVPQNPDARTRDEKHIQEGGCDDDD